MTERPRDPEPDPQTENGVESEDEPGKDEVQEQSEESFPASDPPSY